MQNQYLFLKFIDSTDFHNTRDVSVAFDHLMVINWRRDGIAWKVSPQSFRVRWVWHMVICSLHHLELTLVFFLEWYWSQWCNTQQWRDVCF